MECPMNTETIPCCDISSVLHHHGQQRVDVYLSASLFGRIGSSRSSRIVGSRSCGSRKSIQAKKILFMFSHASFSWHHRAPGCIGKINRKRRSHSRKQTLANSTRNERSNWKLKNRPSDKRNCTQGRSIYRRCRNLWWIDNSTEKYL